MLLALTATAERGKPVIRTANNYINAVISIKRKDYARLEIRSCGDLLKDAYNIRLWQLDANGHETGKLYFGKIFENIE